MSRQSEAQSYYDQSMLRVKNTPEPEGQKFHIGERVWVSKELPKWMCHFTSGIWATIEHTYAHAYGGDDINNYCINIDGKGSTAWYDEYLLSKDGSDAEIPEDSKHYADKCFLCLGAKEFAKDFQDKMYEIFIKASPKTKD